MIDTLPQQAVQQEPPRSVKPALSALSRFLKRCSDTRTRTEKELQTMFEELDKIVTALFAAPPVTLDAESYEDSRATVRQHYLGQPLKRLDRSSPPRRILMAWSNHEQSLFEAAGRLPDRTESSLQEVSAELNLKPARSSRVKAYSLRVPVSNLVITQSKSRANLENKLAYHATESLDIILCSWKQAVLGNPAGLERQKERWASAKASANECLAAWKSLSAKQEEQLSGLILKALTLKPGKLKVRNEFLQEHRESQLRSVEGELHLANAVESSWVSALQELKSVEDALDRERAEVLAEMDIVAQWLRDLLSEEKNPKTKLPQASVRALAFSHRKSDLARGLEACTKALPLNLSVVGHLRAQPKARLKWHQLYPTEAYRSALRLVLPVMERSLEARVLENHQLLQGCDRVRDVIHFGLDLDGNESSVVAREALENAQSLLEHQLSEAESLEARFFPEAEEGLVELFADLNARLDRDSAKAGYQRFKRWLRWESRHFVEGTGTAAGRLSSRLARTASSQAEAFLARIGFTRVETTESTIEVRPYLPPEFARAEEKLLPAVYRRLFRIEPVEDARFLVGRQRELQAFEDALGLWRHGRPVSVILTGQRGSGKTSLLNCLDDQLDSFTVARGSFRERLLKAEEMDAFLHQLLQLDPSEDLIRQLLKGEPRIVIIEEMERTFLRHVGGYGAIRRLQNIIQATGRQVMWVLAINEVSYNFLCSAVSISQGFTHRMKTAVANRKDLKQAIMVRHELSGLRLRFSSRFERPSRWRDLSQRLNKGQDPETVFFERLASQSRGVYRTALEVWLGAIEACEGGILYMRQISELTLDDIVAELDTSDLFSLVAILQHGSLTLQEHSQIFALNLESSAGQLEELVSRELLEEDPVHIGLRVRPEAMPVVKEALFRRNLL